MIPTWIAFYRAPNQRRAGSAFDREFQAAAVASRRGRNLLAAFGPPGSTVRVYYAEHAGQTVLLHVATGKHGRGKLSGSTRQLVEQRLAKWRQLFPNGAELDDQNRLVARR